MSSLWYFNALICSYLWSRLENMARARVSWDDYMMPKKFGGLGLTLPDDAMGALMSKWIIWALLPGQLNLQITLTYGITLMQPSYHNLWGLSSFWTFYPNFSTKRGCNVWHHITRIWKVMANTNADLSPSIPKDILQLNLWWRTEYQGLYFGITMGKVLTLYRKWLRYFQGYLGSWEIWTSRMGGCQN